MRLDIPRPPAATMLAVPQPVEPAAPLVLALDVGTSSCRSALYDGRGGRLPGGGQKAAYEPTVTPEGGAEHDPLALFARACGVLDTAAAAAPGPIAAVSPTTFWHSLMGLDARGEPLTPVYLWLDARSRDDAEALAQRLDARAVHARTGCVLHWSYWPAKLAWLRRTQPETFRAVRRWVSFGEFLLLRLTGRAGVSISMASGTGLLDQRTCAWDPQLLDATGISPDTLSPLVDLASGMAPLSAAYATRWPRLDGVPWLPAVGDGATSNLGAGCATADRLALMVGTSGALRALYRTRRVEVPPGLWCYRLDRERVVVGGALNDGGALLAWLVDSLRIGSFKEVERQVAALAPAAHGLTVLPFWGGERSPGWAPDARGAILGLRLHTRPAHIVRAAMEAVALHFASIARLLGEAVPATCEVVATGGGLLRSPTWLQVMADVLDRPVLASNETEASSRGAALLALETLGLLREPLDALQPSVQHIYQPVPANVARYREAAAQQQRAYDRLIQVRPAHLPTQGDLWRPGP